MNRVPNHVFKIWDNFSSFVLFYLLGIKLNCALCNRERFKSIIQVPCDEGVWQVNGDCRNKSGIFQ